MGRAARQAAYKKSGKRLNMGGCCVHFKELDDLPLDVVGTTVGCIAVDQYVGRYLRSRTKTSPYKNTTKTKTKIGKANR